MDRPEWISRARPVENVSVDVGFCVSESFYYGPENFSTREMWEQMREPLYQPKFELLGRLLLSLKLRESSAELIRHYRDVVRVAARHRKRIELGSPYFWMKPVLFAPGEFTIPFAWHDSWLEAAGALDALSRPGDGMLYDYWDQGWRLEAFAEGERFFLRESDPDRDLEHVVITTNRTRLVGKIPVVRNRGERLVRDLTKALGRNYWLDAWFESSKDTWSHDFQ